MLDPWIALQGRVWCQPDTVAIPLYEAHAREYPKDAELCRQAVEHWLEKAKPPPERHIPAMWDEPEPDMSDLPEELFD